MGGVERGKETEGSCSATRNSYLREKTASFAEGIAEKLHERFPGLTANQLTLAGLIGVGIGAYLASLRDGKNPRKDALLTAGSATITIGSSLLDALDGNLARIIKSENLGVINDSNGQIIDVLSDRTQELILALSRFVSASKRGDTIGQNIALLNAATNPLPSWARAYKEMEGDNVPEMGRGILDRLGNRGMRAVSGIATTTFPEIQGIPVQKIADIAGSVANIYTTLDRLSLARNGEEVLDEKIRKEGKKRFMTLTMMTGISVGTVVVTYYRLQSNKK